MESSMATTSNQKIELIQNAIKQLIESKQASGTEAQITIDDDDDSYLLAKLLSQLESLKGDGTLKSSESTAEPNEVPSCAVDEVKIDSKDETEASANNMVAGAEDVVKELKKLEKQNRITHWLLSGLIVITVAWQLSEVSLLLKLKDGLTHPFKSVGSMVTGALKRPKEALEADNHSSTKHDETKNPLKDLSGMIMNGNEE